MSNLFGINANQEPLNQLELDCHARIEIACARMCSRACSWPCCKCIPQLKSGNRIPVWLVCLSTCLGFSYAFFSTASVSQWPRPPLTGDFQAICKRGDLRLSIQTIRRIWRIFSAIFGHVVFSGLHPIFVRALRSGLRALRLLLQTFSCSSPGVKSRSGGFDQDGQEFCDVHVMCTCGCFDDFILMKHTSWCLHADCKRRFWTGWYKGEHPRLRSIRP